MVEERRDYYIREKPNKPICKPCQTALIDTNFMKYMSGCGAFPAVDDADVKYNDMTFEHYPAVNSYYTYTEDVDIQFRLPRFFYNSKESLLSSAMSLTLQDSIVAKEACSEFDAQLKYLFSPPVSFFIFGKPEIGQEDVGKLLAEYWKCIYVDPHSLIAEEVNAGTRAGKCIEYNLRCGRAIGKDIVLRLLEKRMQSQSVLHKGAVVCGFPLIETLHYARDPVSSESAVFNVADIFDEVIDVTVVTGVPPQVPSETSLTAKKADARSKASDDDDEEDEDADEPEKEDDEEDADEEDEQEKASVGTKGVTRNVVEDTIEPPHDVGSTTCPIVRKDSDTEVTFAEQVDRIFRCVDKGAVIVYLKCENEDVMNIREQYRFDLTSKREVNEYHLPEKHVFTVFPHHAHRHREDLVVNESSRFFYDEINTMVSSSARHMYIFRLPRDAPANVVHQIHSFRHHVQPVLESYLVRHNQQYLIKVDGRANPIKIYNDVRMRLKVLPLQKVIVPQKLAGAAEAREVMGEGDADEGNVATLEGKTAEDSFDVLRNKKVSSRLRYVRLFKVLLYGRKLFMQRVSPKPLIEIFLLSLAPGPIGLL